MINNVERLLAGLGCLFICLLSGCVRDNSEAPRQSVERKATARSPEHSADKKSAGEPAPPPSHSLERETCLVLRLGGSYSSATFLLVTEGPNFTPDDVFKRGRYFRKLENALLFAVQNGYRERIEFQSLRYMAGRSETLEEHEAVPFPAVDSSTKVVPDEIETSWEIESDQTKETRRPLAFRLKEGGGALVVDAWVYGRGPDEKFVLVIGTYLRTIDDLNAKFAKLGRAAPRTIDLGKGVFSGKR